MRNRADVHRSHRADPIGKQFYERRRDTGATWREIADAAAPGRRSDLQPERRADEAYRFARRYAMAHGLPWPLPGIAAMERAARRDEEGMAEVRETIEHERRIRMLLDALPKDRTISRDEAEGFLVELYRTGMRFSQIAQRTNCSWKYAEAVVRRRAPELVRSGTPRRKRTRHVGPLLDLRALRAAWRVEEQRRGRDRQDARMLAAYLAGESLADIARRESTSRIGVWERISAASPEPLPPPGTHRPRT